MAEDLSKLVKIAAVRTTFRPVTTALPDYSEFGKYSAFSMSRSLESRVCSLFFLHGVLALLLLCLRRMLFSAGFLYACMKANYYVKGSFFLMFCPFRVF